MNSPEKDPVFIFRITILFAIYAIHMFITKLPEDIIFIAWIGFMFGVIQAFSPSKLWFWTALPIFVLTLIFNDIIGQYISIALIIYTIHQIIVGVTSDIGLEKTRQVMEAIFTKTPEEEK